MLFTFALEFGVPGVGIPPGIVVSQLTVPLPFAIVVVLNVETDDWNEKIKRFLHPK